MTVITVTTVGYREVHVLSRAGEGSRCCPAHRRRRHGALHVHAARDRGGRGRLAPPAGAAADPAHDRAARRHFIVCGYGRIGSVVAEEFRREGMPFVVVERDPERVHEVIAAGMLAVEADASREEVLQRLGIERARGLIAAVGTDAENVYAILTARVLAPNLFIVGSRGNRGCGAQAAAGRRQPRRLAVSHRRRADGADGTAAGGRRFRAARDQLRQPRSRDGADQDRVRVGARRIGRSWTPTCGSGSASSSSASSAAAASMEFNPSADACDAGRRSSSSCSVGRQASRIWSRPRQPRAAY